MRMIIRNMRNNRMRMIIRNIRNNRMRMTPQYMMHTAEFLKKFEYLGEIETEIENILVCLSGAQMGSNHKKMEVENLVTHSL